MITGIPCRVEFSNGYKAGIVYLDIPIADIYDTLGFPQTFEAFLDDGMRQELCARYKTIKEDFYTAWRGAPSFFNIDTLAREMVSHPQHAVKKAYLCDTKEEASRYAIAFFMKVYPEQMTDVNFPEQANTLQDYPLITVDFKIDAGVMFFSQNELARILCEACDEDEDLRNFPRDVASFMASFLPLPSKTHDNQLDSQRSRYTLKISIVDIYQAFLQYPTIRALPKEFFLARSEHYFIVNEYAMHFRSYGMYPEQRYSITAWTWSRPHRRILENVRKHDEARLPSLPPIPSISDRLFVIESRRQQVYHYFFDKHTALLIMQYCMEDHYYNISHLRVEKLYFYIACHDEEKFTTALNDIKSLAFSTERRLYLDDILKSFKYYLERHILLAPFKEKLAVFFRDI